MGNLDQRYRVQQERLEAAGQSHLLAFWPELTAAERTTLLDDLERVDLERCLPLIDSHVRRRPDVHLPDTIEPPSILPAAADEASAALYRTALSRGERAVRDGQVAAFTVAGGQGTRLGYDGPKGAFEISPIRNASLFQLFAEFLQGVQRRYGKCPLWYIMTSDTNHAETLGFFEERSYFHLPRDHIRFFRQGMMPAFLPDGRIALSEKHRLALSPNGHGGSLQALADSGALREMAGQGVEVISYFQVDNPLARPIDPLFVGLHLETGSEMGSKAVTKADDLERVGNFCLADGKLAVIEYSDLPEELARSRHPDGSRRFDAGSIAIHSLSRTFVERLTALEAKITLPWHRADKKVAVVNDRGEVENPATPNVVKLEMFVFDAIPLALNPFVLYTPREEEFSPVKNADGVDSPASARRDLVRRAARWLGQCGCAVPQDGAEPAISVEISPAYALDAVDLADRFRDSRAPTPVRGKPLLLA